MSRLSRGKLDSVPIPHPLNRLAEVAAGMRALAAELERIQGEPPVNILWWAGEIEAAVEELQASVRDRPLSERT